MQRRSFKFNPFYKKKKKKRQKERKRRNAKYIKEKHRFSHWWDKVGAYLCQLLHVKYACHLILHSISNNNNTEAANALAIW